MRLNNSLTRFHIKDRDMLSILTLTQAISKSSFSIITPPRSPSARGAETPRSSTGRFGNHSELTGVTRNLRSISSGVAYGGPKKAGREKGSVSPVLKDGRCGASRSRRADGSSRRCRHLPNRHSRSRGKRRHPQVCSACQAQKAAR